MVKFSTYKKKQENTLIPKTDSKTNKVEDAVELHEIKLDKIH